VLPHRKVVCSGNSLLNESESSEWLLWSVVYVTCVLLCCGDVWLRAVMAEHNTIVCSFDPSSPRITAYEIHEWIHASLRVQEHKVSTIQIDGIKRQVFIKFVNDESVHALLRDTCGRAVYKYPNGELSIANIDLAGMGTKHIRVANLSLEVSKDTLHASLVSFGKVLNVHNEVWSKAYRYPV
jgi:hypothetical protein